MGPDLLTGQMKINSALKQKSMDPSLLVKSAHSFSKVGDRLCYIDQWSAAVSMQVIGSGGEGGGGDFGSPLDEIYGQQ